jgi:hypothetical protein
MIKKILVDGSPCRKCAEVEARLRANGYWQRLDAVVVADERDPASPGMELARRHGVTVAPFFLVEHDDGRVDVHTIFLRFLREVLQAGANPAAEAQEILERGPDLDFL